MKLKLSQVFTLSLLGLAGMLGVLFYVVLQASRASIVESSERVREEASREIGERVTRFLDKAPAALRRIQLEIQHGLFDPRDGGALETALFAPLLADPEIGEMTMTYGRKTGFDHGAIQLAAVPRGELSVERSAGTGGEDRLWSRHVHRAGLRFVSDRRELAGTAESGELSLQREAGTDFFDPTLHPTFTTPASERWYGKLLPSDLHWSQLDAEAALPEEQRRVEVSVQQVITDSANDFVGVLRVGLLAQQLERSVLMKIDAGGDGKTPDPHRIFICDVLGRLITRGEAGDRPVDLDGDLRLTPRDLAPEITRALALPKLHELRQHGPVVSETFRSGHEDYFATFRALPGTQDWVVGVVVPRAYYLGRLNAMRNQLLLILLVVIAVLVAAGGLVLRAMGKAQAQIVRQTAKMKSFKFTPSSTRSPFRDVTEVLEGLEQAKTAMRAMGKYVPIDLVRRLYRTRQEPVLGSELIKISVMFTDIKDFTTLVERMKPNELAAALGQYLETMSQVIQQECHGTIDKFMGDAIMTIWNAPEQMTNHARLACQAALRCREAALALVGGEAWGNWPRFETRFGLHLDQALVGNFGAPDRLNYTAIGDAINLASRLEGLNKQYGTSIIVSEKIVEHAGDGFTFRLLDLVAVKGKVEAIKIYELLGEKGAPHADERWVNGYEKAFRAYLEGDFATAVKVLQFQGYDGPSRVLLERCQAYRDNPPPAGWRGVFVATEK